MNKQVQTVYESCQAGSSWESSGNTAVSLETAETASQFIDGSNLGDVECVPLPDGTLEISFDGRIYDIVDSFVKKRV
jgi:hypothetical protein